MYFDYSATTPLCQEALDAFCKISQQLVGNPQSKHTLGKQNQTQINQDKKKLKQQCNLPHHSLSFCANASHANTLVIDQVLSQPQNMHVICGPFEHPSIIRKLSLLQQKGLKIDFLEIDKTGHIYPKDILSLTKPNTHLIILSLMDSELGIIQPIQKAKSFAKTIPFLCDITQAIGKVDFNLEAIEYLSFSAHKFYGPKGIGGIFHLSNDSFEQGTQSNALIHSTRCALNYTLKQDHTHVQQLNITLRKALSDLDFVFINSPYGASDYALNISIITKKPIDLVDYFSNKQIYLSKASACQTHTYSNTIYKLTHDLERAKTSIRISLSHLTTHKELDTLIEAIKELKHE